MDHTLPCDLDITVDVDRDHTHDHDDGDKDVTLVSLNPRWRNIRIPHQKSDGMYYIVLLAFQPLFDKASVRCHRHR